MFYSQRDIDAKIEDAGRYEIAVYSACAGADPSTVSLCQFSSFSPFYSVNFMLNSIDLIGQT